MFDEVRNRRNTARVLHRRLFAAQYDFEEACAQACYNAIEPDDAFDASAPFFVVPTALTLSRQLGLDDAAVIDAARL